MQSDIAKVTKLIKFFRGYDRDCLFDDDVANDLIKSFTAKQSSWFYNHINAFTEYVSSTELFETLYSDEEIDEFNKVLPFGVWVGEDYLLDTPSREHCLTVGNILDELEWM